MGSVRGGIVIWVGSSVRRGCGGSLAFRVGRGWLVGQGMGVRRMWGGCVCPGVMARVGVR